MISKRTIVGIVVATIVLFGVVLGREFSREADVLPQTFDEMVQLPDEAIERLDVARINLLCAKGLPGSEGLDVEKCLNKLDAWARHVLVQEQKYLPVFPRYREKYKTRWLCSRESIWE